MSVYKAELAITVATNEKLDYRIRLTKKVDGVKVPWDLTGRSFFAQAKNDPADTEVALTMTVQPFGDPTEGILRFTAPLSEVKDLKPTKKGTYDLLEALDGDDPDNVYMSAFTVLKGVSKWPG